MSAFSPDRLRLLRLILESRAAGRHLRRSQRHGRPWEAVVEELRQRGWLTTFQADHILSGRGASLIVCGRYVLRDRVGRGGMGTVYRAFDRKLRREVALKFLRVPAGATAAERQQRLRRFVREARLTARAGPHPNIVSLYDAKRTVKGMFLVLEWIDGLDLFTLVQRNRVRSWAEACRLTADLCRGLEHLNELGIVHRDLKARNAVRTRAGVGKLLDLGIARHFRARPGEEELLTSPGTALGTPGNMAPEAFVDGHAVDARADVFGAATVLYFLGTGHEPFADSHPAEVLRKNARAVLPAMDDVPRRIADILRFALQRDPADRYPSPGHMAAALDRCATEEERRVVVRRWWARAGVAGLVPLVLIALALLLAAVLLRVL